MTASKALPAAAAPETGGRISFVARQPILTADEKVFGYELLFRDGVEDYFREVDCVPSTLRCKLDWKRFATDAEASSIARATFC